MTLFRISNKSAINDFLNYDVFYLTFAEIRSDYNLLSSSAFVKRYIDEAQHNDNTVNMHHKLYICINVTNRKRHNGHWESRY